MFVCVDLYKLQDRNVCVCNVDQKILYVLSCIYLAVIRVKKTLVLLQFKHIPEENVNRAAKRDHFAGQLL